MCYDCMHLEFDSFIFLGSALLHNSYLDPTILVHDLSVEGLLNSDCMYLVFLKKLIDIDRGFFS